MTSSVKHGPASPSTAEGRREKLLRELKLALVDQQTLRESAGCNPYDALQGRGRAERWAPRRR
jgi:hypothetical protein